MNDRPASLRTLAVLKSELDSIHGQIVKAVGYNRSLGISWARIAAELGISKQAAQQKYGKIPAAESELVCPKCGGSSGTNAVHFQINHSVMRDGRCVSQQLRDSHAAYDLAQQQKNGK